MKAFFLFFVVFIIAQSNAHASVLDKLKLTKNDSVLVVRDNGESLFSWQASKPLVPASLSKLVTAHLAIDKWGLGHRFVTDFFIDGDTLWVKGYGDPFLVSEELDLLVPQLKASLIAQGVTEIRQLNIDNSYFDISSVPGRSKVADPYNAPLSAISANFNTAKLSKENGRITSAEAQTPLTNTAKKMAHTLTKNVDRVNLVNADNAQSNFAELLLAKLAWLNVDIEINQALPDSAQLIYQHQNSHTLADVLRGTLEFSNNFMANQVFLKLAESECEPKMSFLMGRDYSSAKLSKQFGWQGHSINEGSGLSRKNLLSAMQIDDLLVALKPNKSLFKKIKLKSSAAEVYAKTGTLNGVRSYAGYIALLAKSPAENTTLGERLNEYRFVFNFNRTVKYKYRDQLLEQLISDLESL